MGRCSHESRRVCAWGAALGGIADGVRRVCRHSRTHRNWRACRLLQVQSGAYMRKFSHVRVVCVHVISLVRQANASPSFSCPCPCPCPKTRPDSHHGAPLQLQDEVDNCRKAYGQVNVMAVCLCGAGTIVFCLLGTSKQVRDQKKCCSGAGCRVGRG